jgi:hypothetical protein
VADPIAELVWAMLLCSGRENAILKLYPRLWSNTGVTTRKNYATHARFTSNPGENIAGFRPGGLKRLEMLLVPENA